MAVAIRMMAMLRLGPGPFFLFFLGWTSSSQTGWLRTKTGHDCIQGQTIRSMLTTHCRFTVRGSLGKDVLDGSFGFDTLDYSQLGQRVEIKSYGGGFNALHVTKGENENAVDLAYRFEKLVLSSFDDKVDIGRGILQIFAGA